MQYLFIYANILIYIMICWEAYYMHFKWDKKYLYWGITAFFVLSCSILFYYIVFHNEQFSGVVKNVINICFPIIDGLIIAFLMCPMINWFEKRIFARIIPKLKKGERLSEIGQKWMRAGSVVLSYSIVLLLLAAFFIAVIPQIRMSVESIVAQSSTYKENIETWIVEIDQKYPELSNIIGDKLNEYTDDLKVWQDENLLPKIQELLTKVSVSVFGFLKALWDIVIGAIISVYIIANKEKYAGQFKKLTYGFLDIKIGNVLISNVRMANQKFSGFIVGKIIDSLIIGILCFIFSSIFQFPYPVLLGLIIGATNVIPFFGPFFGAIPCGLLVFMVNPIQCIWFLLFILALQQFDGNILGPMILGESTGISGFWVIFSITFFGGIWGVPGMIIGVPLFAVIYAIIKTALETKLTKKKLPMVTDQYIYVDYIDESKENEFVDLKFNEYEKEIFNFKLSKKKKNNNDKTK